MPLHTPEEVQEAAARAGSTFFADTRGAIGKVVPNAHGCVFVYILPAGVQRYRVYIAKDDGQIIEALDAQGNERRHYVELRRANVFAARVAARASKAHRAGRDFP